MGKQGSESFIAVCQGFLTKHEEGLTPETRNAVDQGFL